MDAAKEIFAEEFKDKEARLQYGVDLLNAHIALQIKALRLQRGWSQAELAQRAGKHQSQISAMEGIDFYSWKISTLIQLAKAFDVALMVNFESFGQFLDEALRVDRNSLERPSFEDDPAFLRDSIDMGSGSSSNLLRFRQKQIGPLDAMDLDIRHG